MQLRSESEGDMTPRGCSGTRMLLPLKTGQASRGQGMQRVSAARKDRQTDSPCSLQEGVYLTTCQFELVSLMLVF